MDSKTKTILRWAVPLFLAAWAPFRFYRDVADWTAHNEDLFGPLVLLIGVVFCAAGIVRAAKKRAWPALAVNALALASCCFFGYWIWRIPFCPECDPMRRSDLGFMLAPFADRFEPYMPE